MEDDAATIAARPTRARPERRATPVQDSKNLRGLGKVVFAIAVIRDRAKK
jgi:hypothetical protein